jgi:formylglycine-generating enzyme required for sulfatase activity
MTISGDRILHRATVVKPLVLDLLDNLVHIENEHEPGKKPHNDFYMAKTTVSQALWTALMGDNPSVFPKKDEDLRKFPVDDVFLDDCRVFVRNLNDVPEDKQAHLVFRIPRKGEWRFACRAGGASYQSGFEACMARGSSLESEAYYRGHPRSSTLMKAGKGKVGLPITVAVRADIAGSSEIAAKIQEDMSGPCQMGLLKDNGWGLYDMYGNLWEWTCESGDDNGLLFGGSWNNGPKACGYKPRDGVPERGGGITGLRLVATKVRGRKPGVVPGA